MANRTDAVVTRHGRVRPPCNEAQRGRAMERVDLLKRLSFGTQVAEDETRELGTYFLETYQWSQIAKGDIDIVRGDKGAGKSAIYSLLIERASEFFDKRILIVGAENPRLAPVFKDLATEPPTSEAEFVVLWKLYIITVICQKIREYGIKGAAAETAYKALEDARMLEREFSLSGLLRTVQEYARRLIKLEAFEGGIKLNEATGMPEGITGRIVLREPERELKERGLLSIAKLFSLVDGALREYDFKAWVLLDRLDSAFTENHDLEANALRALFKAYLDMWGLSQISLKIFLREDIWTRIMETGFRESSHLIRVAILEWSERSLMNVLMKRILSNRDMLNEFNLSADAILQDFSKQEELFRRLFPEQVDQGPQKPKTFKWMVSRCADGTRKTVPREMIHLLNCLRDEQIRRLEQGGTAPEGDQLFERAVFKLALPTVSRTRLNQYLYAEYPDQKKFVAALENVKTEQTVTQLQSMLERL